VNSKPFAATAEQARVIGHSGSAFIAACPGSGKTRVIVERARVVLTRHPVGRGVALLSFTNAAVSELEDRRRRESALATPSFPHFIGTFDRFLWQFLIAPFGAPGCDARPRLIRDKGSLQVQPFAAGQKLPLECFDRTTSIAIPEMLQRHGFRGNVKPYETAARTARSRLLARGELDFADVREIALGRLHDQVSGPVLGGALSARFQEVIVDEAQDCNPADVAIIEWFRGAGIAVKVICDPNQAIYGFRGGVTVELLALRESFAHGERFVMTGNFRSSQQIARAIVALRAADMRADPDEALGPHRDEPSPIQLLSYRGTGVPSAVGDKFRELTDALGLEGRDCPVIAATRVSAANALGHPTDDGVKVKDLSCRLAAALSSYTLSFEVGGRVDALEEVHKVILELEGHTVGRTYHQYLAGEGLEPASWRPRVLRLIEAVRYEPQRYASPDEWLAEARRVLAAVLPAGGASINQRLRRNNDLGKALSSGTLTGHPARTIHSVKGREFPAVCVVMSPAKAKGIVDHLMGVEGALPTSEEARKVYVGASRAQRLLAIATPKSQAPRLQKLLEGTGASVSLVAL
jgi:DNA helicase II / ATP-dependent DNA helicase PcrA